MAFFAALAFPFPAPTEVQTVLLLLLLLRGLEMVCVLSKDFSVHLIGTVAGSEAYLSSSGLLFGKRLMRKRRRSRRRRREEKKSFLFHKLLRYMQHMTRQRVGQFERFKIFDSKVGDRSRYLETQTEEVPLFIIHCPPPSKIQAELLAMWMNIPNVRY